MVPKTTLWPGSFWSMCAANRAPYDCKMVRKTPQKVLDHASQNVYFIKIWHERSISHTTTEKTHKEQLIISHLIIDQMMLKISWRKTNSPPWSQTPQDWCLHGLSNFMFHPRLHYLLLVQLLAKQQKYPLIPYYQNVSLTTSLIKS